MCLEGERILIIERKIKIPLSTKICICQSAEKEIVKLLHQIDQRCVDTGEKVGKGRTTPLTTEEITKLGNLANIMVLFDCKLDLIGKV